MRSAGVTEPAVVAQVVVVLALTATVAGLVPVLRAVRVDAAGVMRGGENAGAHRSTERGPGPRAAPPPRQGGEFVVLVVHRYRA
jgi:hypothetical protein